MKHTIALVLVVLVALLAGCGDSAIVGSGNIVTQEEPITGFDKVDVNNGFTVDINQGDTFSVVIRADDNIIQYVQVSKQGNALKIAMEPVELESVTLHAEITMPELKDLVLASGSQATVTGSGGDVIVGASGGSTADLSAFPVVNADVRASGQSEVTVNASGRLDAHASGGSTILYLGSPTLGDIKESGPSEVRPK